PGALGLAPLALAPVARPLAHDQGLAVLADDQGLLAGLELGGVLDAPVLGVARELDVDLLGVGAGDGEGVARDAVLLAPVVGHVLKAPVAPHDEVAVDDAAQQAPALAGTGARLLAVGRGGRRRRRAVVGLGPGE